MYKFRKVFFTNHALEELGLGYCNIIDDIDHRILSMLLDRAILSYKYELEYAEYAELDLNKSIKRIASKCRKIGELTGKIKMLDDFMEYVASEDENTQHFLFHNKCIFESMKIMLNMNKIIYDKDKAYFYGKDEVVKHYISDDDRVYENDF